jgi:carboxylate-amine ligase
MKDFYWDLRPKPEYGTIELRVCDTPLAVERAAALACYLQALCRHLLERAEPPPREDDYLVYNYNRFQACRFGQDGTIVHPQTHETLSLREDILATLRRLEPHAQALGSLAAFEHLQEETATGGDAQLLRAAFAEGGSTESVVDAALRRFREGAAP